jgi:hypothetical protein
MFVCPLSIAISVSQKDLQKVAADFNLAIFWCLWQWTADAERHRFDLYPHDASQRQRRFQISEMAIYKDLMQRGFKFDYWDANDQTVTCCTKHAMLDNF